MKKLLVLLLLGFAAACSDEDSTPTAPIDQSPALVPAAELSASAFGETTPLGGGSYRFVSDADPGFAGLDYNTPSSFPFSAINVLQAEQTPEPDDSCTGGSPRFQLNVDTDGDGDSDGNVFVYTEFAPGGCPGDTGNLAEAGGTGEVPGTYDLSQIGGPLFSTYSGADAYFASNPSYRIVGIQFVVDAGWAFGDGEQTITATPTVDVDLPQPPNKNACKKGGWQNYQRANGTTFKNQGDCIQYVNTGK